MILSMDFKQWTAQIDLREADNANHAKLPVSVKGEKSTTKEVY